MTSHADTLFWQRRAWAEWCLICVFAVLLALPTLDWFTGVDSAEPPGENRQLAHKPRFSRWDLLNPQSYLTSAERYFEDHFGFRNSLLYLCQHGKLWLFHEQGGNSAVLRGLHGWLFYDGDEDLIGNYLCLTRFSAAQLQAWQRLLEARRDWLAARGVGYLFVVPPDKQDIYPEELPSWLAKAAPPHRESQLDQLLAYLRAHSSVAILDLRPALLAAKTSGPVYLQNDTHWNDRGSFVACQEVVRALTKQLPGLPPLRSEDFSWSNAPAVGGDLARMIGARPPERNSLAFTPEPGVPLPVVRSAPEAGPGPGIRTLITENPARTVSAVVLHDSFGARWAPFLGCSFKRIVYRWAPGLDPRIIAEYQPQVVIDEMLERFVDSRDPSALLAQDKLP